MRRYLPGKDLMNSARMSCFCSFSSRDMGYVTSRSDNRIRWKIAKWCNMAFLKKIVLFLIMTIVVIFLIAWSFYSFGFNSFVSAFLINWLAMSWVALTGQVINVSFSPGYYAVRPFEQSGLIYECLGIRIFKKLMRSKPWSFLNPTLRLQKGKTLPALQSLEKETRKAEAGHLLVSIIILFFIGYALFKDWFVTAGWMLLFNILFNGYPVMLQRYNRQKLLRLIQKKHENNQSTDTQAD